MSSYHFWFLFPFNQSPATERETDRLADMVDRKQLGGVIKSSRRSAEGNRAGGMPVKCDRSSRINVLWQIATPTKFRGVSLITILSCPRPFGIAGHGSTTCQTITGRWTGTENERGPLNPPRLHRQCGVTTLSPSLGSRFCCLPISILLRPVSFTPISLRVVAERDLRSAPIHPTMAGGSKFENRFFTDTNRQEYKSCCFQTTSPIVSPA